MLLLIVVLLLLCVYGTGVWICDANRFVTVTYEVASGKLKKPYAFAMLSDLHNKAYGKKNEKLIRALCDLPIDSVIVAGDMYTSKEGSGYENAVSLLRAASRKLPVYYANGNHEQKTRLRTAAYGDLYARYTDELKEAGIEPVINGHIRLPEYGIDICASEIGMEYYQHFKREPFPEGYLEELLGEPRRDDFQILIAHNPDYFEEYAAWGADLVLSGHVHGGVVRLPVLGGMISPSVRLFPKYDGGRFTVKDSTMILGRGLGMHTIPIRVWNPGELVVVKLVPEK